MNLSEAWEAAKAGLEAGPDPKPDDTKPDDSKPEAKPAAWLPWERPAAPQDDAAPAPKPDAQPATLEAALARLATLEGFQHDETERRTKRQAERDQRRTEFEAERSKRGEDRKRKRSGVNLFRS